jgi:hypothetical protein
MADPIVKALGAFIADVEGETLDVRGGDLFEANHPAVKKYPKLFGPITFRFPTKGRVEQATAAPGEKRGR